MSWGPWIDNAAPEVGDYVQVESRHQHTGEMKLQEGKIAGFFGTISWFEHELPQIHTNWVAVRWRLWVEPARQKQKVLEKTK